MKEKKSPEQGEVFTSDDGRRLYVVKEETPLEVVSGIWTMATSVIGAITIGILIAYLVTRP